MLLSYGQSLQGEKELALKSFMSTYFFLRFTKPHCSPADAARGKLRGYMRCYFYVAAVEIETKDCFQNVFTALVCVFFFFKFLLPLNGSFDTPLLLRMLS